MKGVSYEFIAAFDFSSSSPFELSSNLFTTNNDYSLNYLINTLFGVVFYFYFYHTSSNLHYEFCSYIIMLGVFFFYILKNECVLIILKLITDRIVVMIGNNF